MYGWYIINIFSKEYYGPFLKKSRAKENAKIVKQIADMCVEIGTNVGIVDCVEFSKDYKDYKKGSIEVIKKRIKKLM